MKISLDTANVAELREGAVTDFEGMIKEGKELAQVAKNVVVKCPLTKDGLKAVKHPDALLLGAPGAAVGQGGRDLHQPLPRPPRRRTSGSRSSSTIEHKSGAKL